MKKFIVVGLILSGITISYCIIHYNSNEYKIRVAEEMRAEQLTERDKIPRLYIYEGVYSFKHEQSITKTAIDKYGEEVEYEENSYSGEGEVSFKADRVIISFQNRKEVFDLGAPIIDYFFLSESMAIYDFPIKNWKAYDMFNYCYYSYDPMKWAMKKNASGQDFAFFLRLNLKSEYAGSRKSIEAQLVLKANFNLIGGFEVFPEIQKISVLDRKSNVIILDALKYTYSKNVPNYVNCSYSADIYEIEQYIQNYKLSSKNPFLLDRYWYR
jgi:hypothetical protein